MLKKEILVQDTREGRLNIYNKDARKALRMRKGKFKALMGESEEVVPEPEANFINTQIIDKTESE